MDEQQTERNAQAQLGKAVGKLLRNHGINIDVEVISVPAGSTLEAEVAKRNGGDQKAAVMDRQQGAVASLDQRIAEVEQGLVLLRELRESIAQPDDDNDSGKKMFKEITLALRLKHMDML